MFISIGKKFKKKTNFPSHKADIHVTLTVVKKQIIYLIEVGWSTNIN